MPNIAVFSIVGLLIIAAAYWAGQKNVVGGLIAAVRGG